MVRRPGLLDKLEELHVLLQVVAAVHHGTWKRCLVYELLDNLQRETGALGNLFWSKPHGKKILGRLQLVLVGSLLTAGGTSHLLLWDVPLGVPRDVFDFRDDVWYSWRCRECP